MMISVDGCVGVGKTTVARGLASYRGSRLLLEEFELNPFLSKFYENPAETAIETEFSFLLLHFHQLKGIAIAASSSEVITDFHLGKDLLYADLNLKDETVHHLFGELYEFCLEGVPKPEVLIFLSAPTALVIERIQARKRDFELAIDHHYYVGVNDAYEEAFCRYPGKKIRVQMDQWDFVRDKGLYGTLSNLIDTELR